MTTPDHYIFDCQTKVCRALIALRYAKSDNHLFGPCITLSIVKKKKVVQETAENHLNKFLADGPFYTNENMRLPEKWQMVVTMVSLYLIKIQF